MRALTADRCGEQRWMKQRGILAPDPKLLSDSSPIRRQLLGGMGDNSHPLGSNPEAGPISQFWWHSQRSHTVFIVPARVAGTAPPG